MRHITVCEHAHRTNLMQRGFEKYINDNGPNRAFGRCALLAPLSPRGGSRWTPEELQVLDAWYHALPPNRDLASLYFFCWQMGRTPAAVESKLTDLYGWAKYLRVFHR